MKGLFIGINYQGQANSLGGCVQDSIHMYHLLKKKYGKKMKYVLLNDQQTNKKRTPTKKNIIYWLKWLIACKGRAFLSYSGHGGSQWDDNHDEVDGKDETIVPLDYHKVGILKDDDLHHILRKMPKQTKLTCVFDCCHSGTILDLTNNYIKKKDTFQYTKFHRKQDIMGRVVCISGCRDPEYSWETYQEKKIQGALTYSFLKTCKLFQKKKVTFEKFLRVMFSILRQQNNKQNPQISSSYPFSFKEIFVF